jgi:ubiquinone biosynthesis accessory factor UbiJ
LRVFSKSIERVAVSAHSVTADESETAESSNPAVSRFHDRLIGGLVAAFVRAFNHLLTQHEWARIELAEHAGRIVALELLTPLGQLSGRVSIGVDGRLVTPTLPRAEIDSDSPTPGNAVEQPASVTVRVPIELALALALIRNGSRGAIRHLKIEGDAALAATIGRLAPHLRWDAEDDLSRMVGDVAAHRLASTARSIVAGLGSLSTRIESRVVSHWVYEDPLLVGRPQFDDFMQQMRELRDALARAEQRVERLSGLKLDSRGSSPSA